MVCIGVWRFDIMLKQHFFCQCFGHLSFGILKIPTLTYTKCISYQLFANDMHCFSSQNKYPTPWSQRCSKILPKSHDLVPSTQWPTTCLTSLDLFSFSHLLPYLHSHQLFGVTLLGWNEKISIPIWTFNFSMCQSLLVHLPHMIFFVS